MLWAWLAGRPANLYKKKRDTVSEVGLFTIMCMAYGDWLNGLTRDKGEEHTALGWLCHQKPFLETFFMVPPVQRTAPMSLEVAQYDLPSLGTTSDLVFLKDLEIWKSIDKCMYFTIPITFKVAL